MLDSLVTLWNVLLVIVGFGFVIFWHELGHFLAARWAKIRVMEFAVGFGPAVVAYRKGIGVRRGTTNPEYERKLAEHREALAASDAPDADPDKVEGVSQTEYRLNWIPLGGYVRMLGQEDANPSATSDKPDSYGSVPVWKRLIVVSGGVIMNVILAAILFVVVYAVGLESNAPAIEVQRGSVAEQAGLETGDVVRSVNGNDVEVFQDLLLKIGLSKKGEPVVIGVERDGTPLSIEVDPEYNEDAQIRAIGVFAMNGATVRSPADDDSRNALGRLLAAYNIGNVQPGWTLVGVGGTPVDPVDVAPWGEIRLPTPLLDAAAASNGDPVELVFATDPSGDARESAELIALPEFDATPMDVDGPLRFPVEHLLGLTPPMRVNDVGEAGVASGLVSGDVFARLGDAEWPNVGQGVRAIRAEKGGTINATVLRDGALVELELAVDDDGRVGFSPGGAFELNYLSAVPELSEEAPEEHTDRRLITTTSAGARLTAIDGVPVASLIEARTAMIEASTPGVAHTFRLTLETTDGTREIEESLDDEAIAHLHALGWSAEDLLRAFAPATVLQVGNGPVHSLALGLRETQRMLTRVYLTLGRLADGSVKPQQLKGPVGITHIGSRVAREGWVRLLFFIGLISANLAVLNFLPLPIVDGGLFLLLCYEGIRGKPAPVRVQNALTLVGLVLIATVFIFVTTNDVLNLFG